VNRWYLVIVTTDMERRNWRRAVLERADHGKEEVVTKRGCASAVYAVALQVERANALGCEEAVSEGE
jgi:hypothetical protein